MTEEQPLQRMLEQQVAGIKPGQYGVICIPMQVTAPLVEPRYVDDLEIAIFFAQQTSAMAGELTPNGEGVLHPELFDTRRYAVYDSSGTQVALYTSGERYQKGN